MTHNDFFVALIDGRDASDPAVGREVAAHRRACAECRAIERCFPGFRELARLACPDPLRLLPRPVAKRLTTLERAKEAASRRRRRRRAGAGGVIATAALSFLLFAGSQLGATRET